VNTTHHEHRPATGGSRGLNRPLKTALLMVAFVGGFFFYGNTGAMSRATGSTCYCWRVP